MRPDRIIMGECRRDETFEMLQAMNTGHDGSMTTIHAASAVEALTRIESLMMYAKFEMPIKVLRYQISEAIDIVVQLKRGQNGRREVSEIIELTGMEKDVITRGHIFERNDKNELVSTGYVPACLERINKTRGNVNAGIFTK
jgi:Flp pilus assembly CpaF family ATPase